MQQIATNNAKRKKLLKAVLVNLNILEYDNGNIKMKFKWFDKCINRNCRLRYI